MNAGWILSGWSNQCQRWQYISLSNICSDTKFSIQHYIAIKDSIDGDVIDGTICTSHKFKSLKISWGWPEFAPLAFIMKSDVLQHGSLIVEVYIKPED